MTANGNAVAEPSTTETSVRIRSSAYLLGNYEMKAKMPGEIQRDFITLVLTVKGSKETDYVLRLSFKHIVRIDLLDNSENEGAGAIIYLNNFMAKSIERLFHFEPNSFLNFRNPYMDHAFIVFDILNSDKATIAMLKQVLNEAAEFHRDYLLSRFKKENDPNPESKLPKQFIWPITSQYWRAFLATMHKEVFVEEVTIGSNDGKEITYASGYMINMVSNNKCTVQPDGRIMPANSEQPNSLLTVRQRASDHLQPRTFALGRLHHSDAPPPKIPRYVTTTQPIIRPRVDEVHTIEDDPTIETAHGADDTLVIKYAPEGQILCNVYQSDLATLGPTEMLNDTVIDFYMNYILHDLLPKEKRDEIYVFNSFFYTKLTKGLGPKLVPKARSKKIAENFSMLKNWTKNVNIFSKNYIIVPINEDTHWYLSVIVNPSIGFVTSKENANGSLDSSSGNAAQTAQNAPEVPVFIFDSLLEIDAVKKHRPVAEVLLEYLHLEYRDKKNEHQLPGVAYRKNACRVIIPDNTPQQQNHYDCGVFMLQFAETFLSRPPKFDEIPTSILYEQLFGNIDLEGKREFIRKLISDLSTNSNRST